MLQGKYFAKKALPPSGKADLLVSFVVHLNLVSPCSPMKSSSEHSSLTLVADGQLAQGQSAPRLSSPSHSIRITLVATNWHTTPSPEWSPNLVFTFPSVDPILLLRRLLGHVCVIELFAYSPSLPGTLYHPPQPIASTFVVLLIVSTLNLLAPTQILEIRYPVISCGDTTSTPLLTHCCV